MNVFKVMERCGVCSEKNYCTPCCHCDKKVCLDCKEGHLDILRREIARVNNQVRRTLPRLQDALGVIDKNSQQLQHNCLNIIEEVEGLYLRLSKALKDRTDGIKSEIEAFMTKELRAMTGLRANLEHEISNFDSNSEFADKHVTVAEGGTTNNQVAWDDNELMDTKDIFLRTMDFIRNFESEPGDYHRRVRFFVPQDPNQLASTLANLGELTILPGPTSSSSGGSQYSQPPTAPTLGPGLMRSKSDHRVAAQFRQAEERYASAYGSDNNDQDNFGVGGGGSRQRYFGERHGSTSTRTSTTDRYGDSSSRRGGEYDYDDSPADSGRRSRFRSRFMRHHDSGDSDNEPSGRSVRFHTNESASESNLAIKNKERQRVLDTEDAARGPLSGITRLADSPRVIKRLQELEQKGRKKKPTPPSTLNLTPATTNYSSLASPSARANTRTTTARQVSEEDEIAKIKKQNKGQEAAASAETTTKKTESSVPSTPTSSVDRPRFNTSSDQSKTPSASRQTSTTSEGTKKSEAESATDEAQTRRRSSYLSPKTGTTVSAPTTPVDPEPSSRPSTLASRTSSPAEESSDRSGRRVGRVSTERFNKSSSESSTSAESSTHSSPVRNTGAAFSTVELKNRFIGGGGGRKSSTGSANGSDSGANSSMATTTTRNRFGNVNSGSSSGTSSSTTGRSTAGTTGSAGAGSSASNGTAATATAAGVAAPHRFQSRFLGRAGTPTAEASRGSENSQSSSSDDSSDSSESDPADTPATNKKTTASSAASQSGSSGKDRELARTDIGPLLARSAQARDTSTYPSSSTSSNSTTSRPSINDSPSSYTPRSRTNPTSSSSLTSSTTTNSRPYGSSSRYDTSSSASGLSRSRTGSSLAEDLENKYPLTSKYLNRSRANLSSDTSSGGGYGADSGYGSSSASSTSTPRSYQRGYQSRFLNKSKSSAALVAPDGKEVVVDDDEDDDEDESVSQTDAPTSSISSTSQSNSLAVPGDERYPSGRSRYAALKDRRSRLARSKSSHDVGPTPLSPTTPSPTEQSAGGGVVGGLATTATHSYGHQLGGQVGDTGTFSQEPTSPTTDAGSGSSLSTWYYWFHSCTFI